MPGCVSSKSSPKPRPEIPCVSPLTDFELLQAEAYAAEVFASPRGRKLKRESRMILGLVMFGGYLLFPSTQERRTRPAYDRRSQVPGPLPES